MVEEKQEEEEDLIEIKIVKEIVLQRFYKYLKVFKKKKLERVLIRKIYIRCSSHQGESPQNGLGDMWTHKQSWLWLMCCTICLPCGHNFREWEEVRDRSKY